MKKLWLHFISISFKKDKQLTSKEREYVKRENILMEYWKCYGWHSICHVTTWNSHITWEIFFKILVLNSHTNNKATLLLKINYSCCFCTVTTNQQVLLKIKLVSIYLHYNYRVILKKYFTLKNFVLHIIKSPRSNLYWFGLVLLYCPQFI